MLAANKLNKFTYFVRTNFMYFFSSTFKCKNNSSGMYGKNSASLTLGWADGEIAKKYNSHSWDVH